MQYRVWFDFAKKFEYIPAWKNVHAHNIEFTFDSKLQIYTWKQNNSTEIWLKRIFFSFYYYCQLMTILTILLR